MVVFTNVESVDGMIDTTFSRFNDV